jgi:hypothetical protein
LFLVASCNFGLEGFTGGGTSDPAAPSETRHQDPLSDASGTTPPGGGGAGPSSSSNGNNTQSTPDASPPPAKKSAYATVILADKPIGYWRFEETSGTVVHDSSGHGHDGTYGAGVVLGEGGLVGDGFAVRLDGSEGAGAQHFIRIPENAGLEPVLHVSVECWVQPDQTSPNVSLVSYGSDGPSPYEPYVLWLNNGIPSVYVVANGSAAAQANDPLTTTEPHYLVEVYDGTLVRLYVDGSPVSSSPATGAISNYDTTNGLGIGSGYSATRASLGGRIDEVAVYDGVLTPEQIANHYAVGRQK